MGLCFGQDTDSFWGPNLYFETHPVDPGWFEPFNVFLWRVLKRKQREPTTWRSPYFQTASQDPSPNGGLLEVGWDQLGGFACFPVTLESISVLEALVDFSATAILHGFLGVQFPVFGGNQLLALTGLRNGSLPVPRIWVRGVPGLSDLLGDSNGLVCAFWEAPKERCPLCVSGHPKGTLKNRQRPEGWLSLVPFC